MHLPPNFSSFARADEAVRQATTEGLAALGFSNYYDFDVYASTTDACLDAGILPLLGTEILAMHEPFRADGRRLNDPTNPGRTYLCGKGIVRLDPLPERAAATLARIREGDAARMRTMLAMLASLFSEAGLPMDLAPDLVAREVAERSGVPVSSVLLQERHAAWACQRRLFELAATEARVAVLTRAYGGAPGANPEDEHGVQAEIRARLMKVGRPAYAPEPFVSLEEATRLIEDLGGFPAYPVVADGADPVGEFEATPSDLVANVRALGVGAVEFIPSRNAPETLDAYVGACREAGLVVTGGTEHNTSSPSSLVPCCRGGTPLPNRVREAFWDGAAIAAAHQARALHGADGFGACNLATLREEGDRILAGVADAGRS